MWLTQCCYSALFQVSASLDWCVKPHVALVTDIPCSMFHMEMYFAGQLRTELPTTHDTRIHLIICMPFNMFTKSIFGAHTFSTLGTTELSFWVHPYVFSHFRFVYCRRNVCTENEMDSEYCEYGLTGPKTWGTTQSTDHTDMDILWSETPSCDAPTAC